MGIKFIIHTLSAVHNIANLYLEMNLCHKAKSFFERCVNGFERVLGKAHPQTVQAVKSFAVLLIRNGETAEREALCKRFPITMIP